MHCFKKDQRNPTFTLQDGTKRYFQSCWGFSNEVYCHYHSMSSVSQSNPTRTESQQRVPSPALQSWPEYQTEDLVYCTPKSKTAASRVPLPAFSLNLRCWANNENLDGCKNNKKKKIKNKLISTSSTHLMSRDLGTAQDCIKEMANRTVFQNWNQNVSIAPWWWATEEGFMTPPQLFQVSTPQRKMVSVI